MPRWAVARQRRVAGRPDRGAVAVEFALVFPFLILVVFAIIQYSLYFWAVQGGSSAAREAARRAAVGAPTSCTDFRAQVRSNVDSLATNTATVTRTFADSKPDVGDDVTISVSFRSLDMGFPFVPFIENGEVTERATARVDYLPDPTIGNCS